MPVDVDNTTGDIEYEGNVIVHGNVRAGFTLKASGDITIMGVVEGANVDAGGNLTVNRGIQGMNKAQIHAGGDIVSKFVENATIVCGGNIETDCFGICFGRRKDYRQWKERSFSRRNSKSRAACHGQTDWEYDGNSHECVCRS